jgi:hypothetical protein
VPFNWHHAGSLLYLAPSIYPSAHADVLRTAAECLALQGYDKYVLGAYVVCGVVLSLALLTIIIAVVLRKDDSANVWLARWVRRLQRCSSNSCWCSSTWQTLLPCITPAYSLVCSLMRMATLCWKDGMLL